jgi:hypothetical protein
MSTGIYTRSAENQYLMHTDVANNIFFKSNGTYLGSGSIASTNFITNFALSTPTAPLTWGYTGYIYDNIKTAGAPSVDGTSYIPPSAYWIAESGNQANAFQMYLEAAATHIHAFGVTQYASGYGFACNSANASIAVSNEYKGFSIHNNSAGSKIRTGSAIGLAFLPAVGNNSTTFSQPTGVNIVFDKPYDAPPLIFIVESSGPIALNFISHDGNGKYVGAEIIPAATISNSGDARGVAAYTNNSVTFSYFLVSSEAPQYPSINTYGMKVFSSSNECIFDSTSFIPFIGRFDIRKPFFCMDADRVYRYHSTVSLTIPSSYYGVCINNFSAFSNTTMYASFAINDNYGGPMNFCGRYLNKNASGVTCHGAATLAILRSNMYPGTSQPASWDFTRGGDQEMPLLYANYVI